MKRYAYQIRMANGVWLTVGSDVYFTWTGERRSWIVSQGKRK